MEGELKNVVEVWSAAITSLCYCYFVSAKIGKGKYRLISLLPVLILFTILPLHLTTTFLTIFNASCLVCLANFHLLLFAFDLGPLSPNPDPQSLPLFIGLACFPLKIKQTHNHTSPSRSKFSKWILNLPTETILISLATFFVDQYRETLDQNPKIKMAIYCCFVFLIVDLVMAISNFVVMMLLGLEFDPPSDEPFFSTSLQDFWGRRWNLMVTNHLRHTVYNPVRSTLRSVVGTKWARAIGVLAAFVVSGLMHELIFYYSTRVRPTWEMTGFFVLHGICVVIEQGVKSAVKGRWRLHWALSGPLTVGFVVASSVWLFFPPLLRDGVDVRIQEEFILFANLLKSKFLLIL